MGVAAIRIVSLADPPFTYACFAQHPASCPRPGIEVEFIYTLVSNPGWLGLMGGEAECS